MTEHAAPVLYTLFLWWFSTGALLWLNGLPPRTYRWSLLGATVAAAASGAGLAWSRLDASPEGAYLAFTCALVVWGWHQMSFYMGVVTGPRREPCPAGCSGWRHFGHGIETTLHHELAIAATAIAIAWLTAGCANQVGTWTFLVLWWMHVSAKLNVFLGVRNLNLEFLPDHLRYLDTFLKERPMNLLLPFSITVSTVLATVLVQTAVAAQATAFESVGATLLATLLVLAILEHWFLVLPIPAERLWQWGLRSREAVAASERASVWPDPPSPR